MDSLEKFKLLPLADDFSGEMTSQKAIASIKAIARLGARSEIRIYKIDAIPRTTEWTKRKMRVPVINNPVNPGKFTSKKYTRHYTAFPRLWRIFLSHLGKYDINPGNWWDTYSRT